MTSNKNIVSFSYGVFNDRHPETFAVSVSIDGIALQQRVSEFEKVRGYEPAGSYGPIIPEWFNYGPLEKYFVGDFDRDDYWARLGAQYVLGCECGEVGCWPLLCRILVQGTDVIWDRFRQPHRETWDYSTFGPFVFDAAQYQEALAKLMLQMAGPGGDSRR